MFKDNKEKHEKDHMPDQEQNPSQIAFGYIDTLQLL